MQQDRRRPGRRFRPFESIFSDAHVVDIDLSAWDKQIALYVLAHFMEPSVPGEMPMFIVEFLRVRHWEITFTHLSFNPPLELGPHEHVQWRITSFEVQPVEGGRQITLWQNASTSPHMTVVCEDVHIREFPLNRPETKRLFPEWFRPSSGFIRPGLAAWTRDRDGRPI